MAQPHTIVSECAAPRSSGLPAWVHGFAWGVMILLAMVLVGRSRSGRNRHVWEGWRQSSEPQRLAYAEAVYVNAVFRTRTNTWSKASQFPGRPA